MVENQNQMALAPQFRGLSIAPQYVVTLLLQGVPHVQIWDSSNPMVLGHRIPWKLVRLEDGSVQLVHDAGQICLVKSENIIESTLLKLPEVDGIVSEGILFSLKKVERPKAVFQFDSSLNERASIQVYRCAGSWIIESEKFTDEYIGGVGGKPIFSIKKEDGIYRVRALASKEIEFITPDGSMKKAQASLTTHQLTETTLAYGVFKWTFNKIDAPSIPIPLIPLAMEDAVFRKTIGAVAASFALFMIFMLSMADKEPEKKEEEVQVARIVLEKLPPPPVPMRKAVEMPKEPEKKVPEIVREVKEKPQEIKQVKTEAVPLNTPKKAAQTVTAQNNVKAPPNPGTVGKQDAPKEFSKADSIKPGKEVFANTNKHEPPKKTVAPAVLQAEKLKNSMASLVGGLRPLLSKSDIMASASNSKHGGSKVFGAKDEALTGTSPVVDRFQRNNVKVGYSDTGGGGQGNGGVSYRNSAAGGGVSGNGNSFVTVWGTSDGTPAMVEGGLTREEVAAVINRHWSEIRNCWERSMIKKPNVEGKLVVDFTIAQNGRVSGTKIKSSSVADPSLNTCVVQRLMAWNFPQPKGNIEVAVMYPFIFKRL